MIIALLLSFPVAQPSVGHLYQRCILYTYFCLVWQSFWCHYLVLGCYCGGDEDSSLRLAVLPVVVAVWRLVVHSIGGLGRIEVV